MSKNDFKNIIKRVSISLEKCLEERNKEGAGYKDFDHKMFKNMLRNLAYFSNIDRHLTISKGNNHMTNEILQLISEFCREGCSLKEFFQKEKNLKKHENAKKFLSYGASRSFLKNNSYEKMYRSIENFIECYTFCETVKHFNQNKDRVRSLRQSLFLVQNNVKQTLFGGLHAIKEKQETIDNNIIYKKSIKKRIFSDGKYTKKPSIGHGINLKQSVLKESYDSTLSTVTKKVNPYKQWASNVKKQIAKKNNDHIFIKPSATYRELMEGKKNNSTSNNNKEKSYHVIYKEIANSIKGKLDSKKDTKDLDKTINNDTKSLKSPNKRYKLSIFSKSPCKTNSKESYTLSPTTDNSKKFCSHKKSSKKVRIFKPLLKKPGTKVYKFRINKAITNRFERPTNTNGGYYKTLYQGI